MLKIITSDSQKASRTAEGARRGPEPALPGWPTARNLTLFLLACYGLHVAIRVALSPSADLDESEQLLLSQTLGWGYGPQPPLYTWIQAAVFSINGPSIAGLALFKNLLLLGTALVIYWTGRLMTGRHDYGLAAAFSLFFLPQFCWESQRDLTHSVLASGVSAATLLCWWQTHKTGRLGWYVALGLCAGLGLLSKYNFALLFVSLFIATLSLRETRAMVLDRRMLLSLAIMSVLITPNALWLWQHQGLALATTTKFDIQAGHWRFTTGLAALKEMLQTAAAFVAPLAVFYLLLF